MTLLRQILGVLSVGLGLALLGECAAHTVHALATQGIHRDLAVHVLKDAFFSLGNHSPAYLILFASGAVLSLMGVVLTRSWAMPFYLFSGLCFAVLGGMAVGRIVLKQGEKAAIVQDGISGLATVFSEGAAVGNWDSVMVLGLGVFGLMTGLFLTHWKPLARPQAAPRREHPAARGPQAFAHTPSPADAAADTSVDLDLSPDVETSEVHAPEESLSPLDEPLDEPAEPPPASSEESTPPSEGALPEPPLPEEQAPSLDQPPAEEPSAEPAAPPEPEEEPEPPPGIALPAGGIVLGLASVSASGILFLLSERFQDPVTVGYVWGGGVAAGLSGLGLAVLSRPLKLLGWVAVGASATGLAGAGVLLTMGGA